MLEHIKNGDLVITPNNIKTEILKELSKNKKLLNIKFMTINEFKTNYFGTYDNAAIYYLIKNHNLKYAVAKEYLDNIFFSVPLLKPYQDELKQNNLLKQNPKFKSTLKNITVIGYDKNHLDSYIVKELDKYNTTYIKNQSQNYIPKIYGFDKQEDEIAFIAQDIAKKLETEDINNIHLVNVTDEYKNEVKRIFSWYNLPINLEEVKNIYSTETTQMFLTTLIQTKNINKTIKDLPQNDIYNTIIDILNKYTHIIENPNKIDSAFIEIIKNELKATNIKIPKLTKAINIENINTLNVKSANHHYYILGFNQGIVPKIYHDDELIKDEQRKDLGLNTSLEKLLNEKAHITELIYRTPNLTITYKLKDNYKTYYPSPLISELKLEVIKNPKITYTNSHIYNQIKLTIALDNYIKYNEKDNNLENLYTTYPNIPYQTYDNKYTKVDFHTLETYLKGKTNLSYSSMNNYFLCAFRFYIANILKLDPFEENFAAFIGSLFHECLSKMYNEDFDLKKTYMEYQSTKELTAKEKFFTKKLYTTLEFIIDTIKKQESYSKLNKVLTEEKIEIDKSSKLTIKFLGFVDKIKYTTENDKTLVAIIDYKTGNIKTTLDNINYGLHLQLPVYIYLTKHGLHKNAQIVGFYLQKILNQPEMDTDNVKDDIYKKLKLDGYTINDENLIQKFDETYENSEVIKGMKTTKTGFYNYTKLVSSEGIDKIENLVSAKVDEVVKAIDNATFPINPKRIDGKLIGCEFCKFKDLCFRKEEDIINLKNTKFEDIIGGDN